LTQNGILPALTFVSLLRSAPDPRLCRRTASVLPAKTLKQHYAVVEPIIIWNLSSIRTSHPELAQLLSARTARPRLSSPTWVRKPSQKTTRL